MRIEYIVWIINFTIILQLFSATADARNYSNQDDEYGKTWMYFPDGDGVPQKIYLSEPPEMGRARGRSKPVKERVNFELYTRKAAREPKVLQLRKKRSALDDFNDYFRPNVQTYVVVHGWKSSTKSDTVQDIKDGLLNTRDCNVIAVDWSEVASNNYYFAPAKQTQEVGQYLAELIDYLSKERGADTKKFHLIGHSLGAHTVGYAASYTKSGRIPRITGLDPARPYFEGRAGPEASLDKTDADFVDVIHSCGGALGYEEPLGHVDFYPNSGKPSQPGCNGFWKEVLEACSHGRSHQFFAESITSQKGFKAYPCASWESFSKGECNSDPIPMGINTPKSASGVYYLKTSDSKPFAMGR